MPSRMMSAIAVALTLSVSPVALAQTGSSGTGDMAPSQDSMPSDSTPSQSRMDRDRDTVGESVRPLRQAQQDRARGQGYDVPSDLEQSVEPRMGPGQRELELAQTTLLNRFSTLGFTDLRNFRKEGPRYLAEVKTQEGNWVNVEIDPVSGEVTTAR